MRERNAVQDPVRSVALAFRNIQGHSITMEDFWINKGWYRLDRNTGNVVLFKLGKWSDPGIRKEAIRFLAEQVVKKRPQDLQEKDFKDNRLGGLLVQYFEHSPHKAVQFAYPDLDIKPWEMRTAPQGFYSDNKVAALAIREALLKHPAINPRYATKELLVSLGVRTALGHFGNSTAKAIGAAFPELNIIPGEMRNEPAIRQVRRARLLKEKLAQLRQEYTGESPDLLVWMAMKGVKSAISARIIIAEAATRLEVKYPALFREEIMALIIANPNKRAADVVATEHTKLLLLRR